MTDNEIIKALECCSNCEKGCCRNCFLNSWVDIGICQDELIDEAYNLVNRQKAEIERLKFENLALSQNRITMPERLEIVNNARDKAIREFAERLKNLIYPQLSISTYEKGEAFHFCLDEIDNLVKEITEERK